MTARSELDNYLESIARFPIGEGDGSRDALVQGHLRLVVWRAKGFKRPDGVSLMDLISVGNEALIEAANAFDPSLGNKFSTLASVAIARRIYSFLDSGPHGAIRTPRIPVDYPHPGLFALKSKARNCLELRDDLAGRSSDPFEECSRNNERESAKVVLRALLSRISKRDREILLSRFSGKSLREVARIQGVTKERVRQIQKRALIKLRTLAGVA